MKRKIISSVLAAALATNVCCIGVADHISAADEQLSYGDLFYKINSSGNVTITGYNKEVTSIIIPSEIDGKAVTEIADKTFSDYAFGGVVIPDSVTRIGQNTFWNSNGDDVTIFGSEGSFAQAYAEYQEIPFYSPEQLSGSFNETIKWEFDLSDFKLTLTGTGAMPEYSENWLECYIAEEYMPWYTFRNAIQTAEVCEGITSLGEAAFYECYNLKSVTMADSVTTVYEFALSECKHLYDVKFSDSLEYLDNYIFIRCYALEEVNLPSTLKTFYSSAFNGCDSLKAVNIADGGERYCSVDGVVYTADMKELRFYPDAKPDISFKVPDGVETIGYNAIEGAESLKEIILPDTLTTIQSEGLALNGFTSVVIPPNVSYIGNYALYSYKLESVIFTGNAPKGSSTSMFYDKNLSQIECFCHFSYKDWLVFMSLMPEELTWNNLDSYGDGLSLDKNEVSLTVNEEYQLNASISPLLSGNIRWESSDNKIACVSNGIILGIGAGKCQITVSGNDGEFTAVCDVTVLPKDSSSPEESTANLSGKESSNIRTNEYRVWADVVDSYLTELPDGRLERVENIGNSVIVETYDAFGFSLLDSREIVPSAQRFGGFFSGESYNFLVYGNDNPYGSSSTKVLIVDKYSKDWKKIDSLSISSSDTNIPFDAGSCRMTEAGGYLFIHAAQELDIGHQSNMTFKIAEESLELNEKMTFVNTISTLSNFEQEGFASHSFNQFILTDGNSVYRIDHGEGAMHGIGISKCPVNGSIKSVTTLIPFPFNRGDGSNNTGVSVGGAALSVNNVLVAANSVDQTSSKCPYGTRNILISVSSKKLSNAKQVWLTGYNEEDNISVGTPQIVKVGADHFLVMWRESSGNATITKRVLIDGNGNPITKISDMNYPLSDCQPIYTSDGTVKWYVTDSGSPVLYSIDAYEFVSSELKGDANLDGKVSVADAVMLQRWLLGYSNLTYWKNVDLCEDGIIDVFDMALLRRLIVEKRG